MQTTAKPESDAWMAEGTEEIERRMKRAKPADGEDTLGADADLAQHFKVSFLLSIATALSHMLSSSMTINGSKVFVLFMIHQNASMVSANRVGP